MAFKPNLLFILYNNIIVPKIYSKLYTAKNNIMKKKYRDFIKIFLKSVS
jgi:hypothetical protein